MPGCVVNENGYGGWETNVSAAVTPGQPITLTYTAMPWTNLSPVIGNSARYAFDSTMISYRSTLLVPTIWATNDVVLLHTATCSAALPDLTFMVQSDVSSITVTQSPPASTSLPVGTNLVSLTGWDTLGNMTNGTIKVVVIETTPPNIAQCATPQTLAEGAGLPDLRPLLVASDNCAATVNIVQTPVPGTVLPVGTNAVVFNVDDGHGNTNSCATTVAVLSPPVIANGQVLGDGTFQITFSGPSSQSYRVLMTTDVSRPLSSWTVLASGSFGAAPVVYTDMDAPSSPVRFYRIISP
jgi:hypothetical protein